MKPEETIDFHLRWAWHGIARIYNSQADKFGLSMSTGYILLNIDQKTGTPSTKLGPKMGMEPRSLTRTLKTMEEEGLIFRRQDKTDKRMVRIHLTELGRKKRELSKQAVIRLNAYFEDKIPKNRMTQFFEVMTIINKHLVEADPDKIFEL